MTCSVAHFFILQQIFAQPNVTRISQNIPSSAENWYTYHQVLLQTHPRLQFSSRLICWLLPCR